MKTEMRVPLDHPLPAMNTVETADGKWYHVEWIKETLAAAKAAHFKVVYVEEKS